LKVKAFIIIETTATYEN